MEYLAAALLAAETVYCVVCAFRLRKAGRTGRLAAGAASLCAASDLAFLLPLLLTAWLPALRGPWPALGELADCLLSTGAWLLLYLLWEKRFGGEIRDGWSFWTAVGAALVRLLVCAASAAVMLRGEASQAWTLLRLLPLCFLAAAVAAVWRSVRLTRQRCVWLLLIAALGLRLLAAALDTVVDPTLLRLPLLFVHTAIIACLFPASNK